MLRLEWRADWSEGEIKSMRQMQLDTKKELEEFKKILSSIRWILVGAIGLAIIQEVGILEFIKKILF